MPGSTTTPGSARSVAGWLEGMPASDHSAPRPVWTRPIEAVGLVLRGRTVRIAVPVAATVGTVISAVNQADVIITGHATSMTWVRIIVNYVVPYLVASVAYLSACRAR